ncbi:cache domain-containing protein [Neptunomonas marina]|uniref:histidine kinase n=1 Tax=Neptunomonas marina TaxID=1815562 RepID=A0A437Q945_9GAMM|nr:cache domain-containing protein [Neptunomonas marina]RVU30957.1 HAMP domain-containing protein [Neptunomonas marina]
MKNLKIKHKILLLTVLPLTITLVALLFISIAQIRSLGEAEIVQVRQTMMEAKKESLKNYLAIVKTSILPIIKSDQPEDVVRQKVDAVLRSIRYGSNNGYIFAIAYDGITQVQPIKISLEGKNTLELEDENGVRFIEELIRAARNGSGYVEYMWRKPSIEQSAPKLAYAVDLPEFNWILGTGFYIDDIDLVIERRQREIDDKVKATTILSLVVGLVILLVIIAVNLWISNHALVKPIRELSESARQMSLGKMDTEINVESNDEIGELADAVKRMQKSLLVIFKKLKQK